MYCEHCGKESSGNKKFCTSCGTKFPNAPENSVGSTAPSSFLPKSFFEVRKIIPVLILIALIGWGIYASLDDAAVETNNQAISSLESGDSQQAIRQFEEASKEAVTGNTKMVTLRNLGYAYLSDGQYDQALNAFLEALTYTSEGSFDYYLISGEIALLEGKPNAAQLSYNKAYEIDPDDFDINNALNLFYLDLEEVAIYYTNYPKALIHAEKAYDVSESEVKNTARQNLAIAHIFNENYDQTIYLLSFTDLNKEPYFAYWLGWAYALNEDVSNAKFYFQKAVDGGVEGMEQEVYDYLNSY